ncbi:glycoside hydrolase/deacetylase, partial [Basidiobolus meristosporus CBS 931.73]
MMRECSQAPLVQCPVGFCCSKYGFCGKGESFCKVDCLFQCDGHPEASRKSAPPVGTFISHCSIPGTVAMSFVDGPHALTEQLLDTLKAKGLRVTFFVIGNALENPDLKSIVKRAYDEGHHIGSHTYNHIDTTLKTIPENEVREDLIKAEEVIYDAIGKRVRYFRPPSGSNNPAQLKLLKGLGYQTVFWNMDTEDWLHQSPDHVRSVYAKSLQHIDPTKHQILSLHHDDHYASIIAAPDIIKMVEDACYKIVTIPECLGDKQWYKDENVHADHQTPSVDANCTVKYPVLLTDNTTAIEDKSIAPDIAPTLLLNIVIIGMLLSI